MTESNGFKFPCPHCGQRLEAEPDMVGMSIDCPVCGQPLGVPPSDDERKAGVALDAKGGMEAMTDDRRPKIKILKRRESFAERWKKRLKAIGIGIVLLCLFVGVSIIAQVENDATEGGREAASEGGKGVLSSAASVNKKVLSSVECLLDFLKLPNERRLRVLSDRLDAGPDDFKNAVSEYLASVAKNPDDFISSSEKEEAMKAKAGAAILLGLLGAASSGDSQRGVNAGLELGDMAYAELQEKARRRLRDEIEKKRARLVEVAQKYGIDSNTFEEAMVSYER